MAIATASPPVAVVTTTGRRRAPTAGSAVLTLARRRLALAVRTPRELLVPLLPPLLFALVITPALDSIGPNVPGLDYMTYTAIGTAGLLIPLNCMFAGIGAIVDRESGARRDLLAAPIGRSVVVIANLVVALAVTALQVGVLIAAAILRGADVHGSIAGVGWFVAAAGLLAVTMYGVAETLASKTPSVEEYVGAVPGLSVVPFFVAGSLFPISALPGFLTVIGKVLPVTHALALMRYGLLDNSSGLNDIWGMTNATAMAALSLAVVASSAAVLTLVAMRTFTRAAVS